MDNTALLIVAFLALVAGILLGRFSRQISPKSARQSSAYVQGLNFLLEDQSDHAVEEFLRALDVNSDTLETHLSLGKLMRRQGHVNRAIRIHQNALARPALSQEEQHEVHLELARDFMAAGLLDRAELLLKEVILEAPELRRPAQRHLIEIYQDEKEWSDAAKVASSLLQSRYVKSQPEEKRYVQRMISHFYCEQAEQANDSGDVDLAKKLLSQAAGADKTGARVAVLSASRFNIEGNYKAAIKSLSKLNAQNPAWFAACLPTLMESFEGIYGEQGAEKLWLHLQSVSVFPSIPEALFVVRQLVKTGRADDRKLAEQVLSETLGIENAGEGSTGRISAGHRVALLNALAGLELDHDSSGESPRSNTLGALYAALNDYLDTLKMYRCENCGFAGRELHWRCPSCKRWDSCLRIDQPAA